MHLHRTGHHPLVLFRDCPTFPFVAVTVRLLESKVLHSARRQIGQIENLWMRALHQDFKWYASRAYRAALMMRPLLEISAEPNGTRRLAPLDSHKRDIRSAARGHSLMASMHHFKPTHSKITQTSVTDITPLRPHTVVSHSAVAAALVCHTADRAPHNPMQFSCAHLGVFQRLFVGSAPSTPPSYVSDNVTISPAGKPTPPATSSQCRFPPAPPTSVRSIQHFSLSLCDDDGERSIQPAVPATSRLVRMRFSLRRWPDIA